MWEKPWLVADEVQALSFQQQGRLTPEQLMDLFTLLFMFETDVQQWGRLDIKHIAAHRRLYSLVLLADDQMRLTQAEYNYLMGVDLKADLKLKRLSGLENHQKTVLDNLLNQDYWKDTLEQLEVSPAQRKLAEAFTEEMLAEASRYNQPVIGHFELERVGFPYLDKLIDYETVRLSLHPSGIRGALVHQQSVYPFIWKPRGRSSIWILGADVAWGLHVFLACIWRDANVIKDEFVTERSSKIYEPSRRKPRHIRSVTVLPRIIRHVAWSNDEERERITHQAHYVRGHYRELQDGQRASQTAAHNAIEYGWPEPPEGFTFVTPHQRGGEAGEDITPRKVICKGLQVARLALHI